MDNIFIKSKWIWANNSLNEDDYAQFKIPVFGNKKSSYKFYIACDSFYALYLNGKLIKFMECSDFPHMKLYDEIILNLDEGNNELLINVWHYGLDSQKYINDTHGLIFSLFENESFVLGSDENIQSRVMTEFTNGLKKIITTQQGYSFEYNVGKEGTDFSNSDVLEKGRLFNQRKINKINLLDRTDYKIIPSKNANSILIDLGQETSGIPDLDFISPIDQKIIVAYGEHITDGCVRRIIWSKLDFSFTINAIKGSNIVFNPLKRIAGRYIEVIYEQPIQINYIGIRPVNYDHKVITKDFKDPVINDIYSVCIRTLELCMHEHYEDCPWREQCLYALDSRNQALCGYYVFEGYEYPRHNLILLANALKDYELLSICAPCGRDYPIPTFSLFFIVALYEYVLYSKDKSILKEVEHSARTIMKTFSKQIGEKGLLKHFTGKFWNFYEWTDHSDWGCEIGTTDPRPDQYDLILNCLYVYTAEKYNELYNDNIHIEPIKRQIKAVLYNEKENVFYLDDKTDKYSQYGNALACVIGLGNDALLEKILNDKNMIKASLSVKTFLYDALLTKGYKYKQFIIDDIKTTYKAMLDKGATSFWETELGGEDFSGAGSLCHGWSAVPIYYINKLL